MPRSKVLIILSLVLVIALAFWLVVRAVTTPHAASGETVEFVVEEGWGVTNIAQELKKRDLIGSTFMFETLVWLEGVSRELKAGAYQLSPTMSIQEMVRVLAGGQTLSNERVIKLIEGWTAAEMGAYLEKQGIISSAAYVEAAATTDVKIIIADKTYPLLSTKPKNADLEGFLFPDTYRVYKDSTAADIIERQLEALEKKVDDDLRATIAASGRSFFEVLTMASIVEREVKSGSDRALVADIFWRRLAAGIALEADSTVNYITGKKDPAVSATDLQIDSPYNTYKYKGLPPGPIANPSLSSIKAAAKPETNVYWYFLTKPDGSTVFAKNFEEHVANKTKYLQ